MRSTTLSLTHGRIRLALHTLERGGERAEADPLLLLHPFGESSRFWAKRVFAWGGPVYALDFAGHGSSDWHRGSAYTAEMFCADADIALAHLGRARIAGAGLGAYVALLLAGARPDSVPAALLSPGRGLDGGGPGPDAEAIRRHVDSVHAADAPSVREAGGAPDPLLGDGRDDPRPPDYAQSFGEAARRLLLAEDGTPRPPWWEALRTGPRAETCPGEWTQALARLAAVDTSPSR